MKLSVVSFFAILLSFSILLAAASSQSVLKVEYFYMTFPPNCPECVDPNVTRVNDVVREIEIQYGERIQVERLDIMTVEGQERWNYYNLGTFRPTAVLNGTRVIKDTPQEPITKDSLAKAIDEFVGTDSSVVGVLQRFFLSEVALALYLGIISGFSPCLIAMLAFILTYSAGTSKGFKSGTGRTFVFGLGLVTAILVIGVIVLYFQLPSFFVVMNYLHSLTIVGAAVMIVVGLHLIGILKLPFSVTPWLATKFQNSPLGLYLFGMLFFFVKIPCAFPFFVVLLTSLALAGTLANFSIFIAFSIGLLIPFIGIGIISGGAPSLARGFMEKHRQKIRALSGLILLVYSLWLILSQIPWPRF